jgi:hypothetical protein
MSTLIDVSTYFKGEKVPYGHPFQKPSQANLATEKNENHSQKASDNQNGYVKGKAQNKTRNPKKDEGK